MMVLPHSTQSHWSITKDDTSAYQGGGIGSIKAREVDWRSAVVGGAGDGSRRGRSEGRSTLESSDPDGAEDLSGEHGCGWGIGML
jgi:hypothetical protein